MDNSSSLQAVPEILRRLEEIKADLAALAEQRTVRDSNTPKQLAKILGKTPYTVREWCRLERIAATKLPGGRGNAGEWRVSHEELVRYQNEGLRPLSREAAMRY